MQLGTQVAPRDDMDYRMWAQLGVTHVCVDPPGNPHGWTLDDLARLRDHVAGFGLELAMVQLPMNSRPMEQQESPHILLGKSPERDREIDSICRLIENMAKAGIPAAKYNMNIIGIPRTPDAIGRGGSRNAAFYWDQADQTTAPGMAGVVSEDDNWERIDYFLARVVPVAAANKIRLACHPHDPYTPPGYRGVTRVLGTVEGLKRFVSMHENPYHGLNFCQGSVGEMLDNPGEEIFDVIRWFGERGKIFNVHFRNIKGGKLGFHETFPEEGDMDMARSLALYHALGYPYMIMPDHVPTIDARDPSGTAFAFCYGYIRALMQVLEAGGTIAK
jgi:mannonate dehydratase